MKNSCFTLLLVLALFSTLAVAQLSPDQEQRIQKLENTIEQQQQTIQALENRLQATDEKVAEEYLLSPEAEDEGAQFGYEDGRGFFLRVPNFELYMSGALQMGIAIFENDTPDDNSVYPNGVWLTTDVFLFKDWHGRVEVNFHVWAVNMFQGPTFADGTQLWDAYIEYLGMRDEFDNPTLSLRVGQTHVPFTIAGQWNPNQGVTIWGTPFINGWSHGRDPGIMLWGVLSDMVEYKLGVFNGEGRTTTNATDDFLFAGGFRIYPMQKSKEPGVFFHVGAIRSRNDNVDNAGVNAATLATPWLRSVYDQAARIDTDGVGGADSGFDVTQGWKTGVDVGFEADMALGDDNVNHIRVESEFMYITWERDFATGRLPFLEGFGATFGFSFRHNLTPETPGAGIFPLFMISYSDVDNKNTDSTRFGGEIPGQRVWTYTFGLGYAFNSHVSAAFNWVMVDLDEKDAYNVGGNAAKDDRPDGSDDLEHGWFLQFTAAW